MYCKICDKDFSDTEVTRWETEIYCPDCGHSIKLTDSRNQKILDMDSKLINLARSNYENKPTPELLAIWEKIHQDENLMESVEVIKEILTERGVSLPTGKEKRYCFDCNTQVTPDAEECPTCKKLLFTKKRQPWLAWLISVPLGCLMGIIASTLAAIIIKISVGSQNTFLGFLVGALGLGIMIVTIGYARAKIMSRRDLANWK